MLRKQVLAASTGIPMTANSSKGNTYLAMFWVKVRISFSKVLWMSLVDLSWFLDSSVSIS